HLLAPARPERAPDLTPEELLDLLLVHEAAEPPEQEDEERRQGEHGEVGEGRGELGPAVLAEVLEGGPHHAEELHRTNLRGHGTPRRRCRTIRAVRVTGRAGGARGAGGARAAEGARGGYTLGHGRGRSRTKARLGGGDAVVIGVRCLREHHP